MLRLQTGYRYYEVDQLLVIGRITSLKDMGFKLADIINILEIAPGHSNEKAEKGREYEL